ncbi:unnamed protein product [Alternaria sp. RS040]
MLEDLHRLAANVEVKLTALNMILNRRQETDNTSVIHLQRCVKTAATVVASASTVRGDDIVDESMETSDVMSECGWLMDDLAPSDLTLDWVASLGDGRQASSRWNTLTGIPEPSANVTGSPSASQYTPSPNSPPALSPTHSHARQTSTGSFNLASPTMPTLSSPELGQLGDDDSQGSLSREDETPNINAVKKRRDFSLSSLLSPRIKAKTVSRKARLLRKDDLKINSAGQIMTKRTFVGDGACGKTCFLMKVYVPTLFENYVADLQVDGFKFKCALWDTAGSSDFDRLRQSSNAQTDIFCIWFSIDRWDSLENWLPEVKQYKRKTDPIFLLGFKEDLRQDPKTIEELSNNNQAPITTAKGEEMAKKIGALRYFECSAIRHQGTKEIFHNILSMILAASPQLKKRYKSGNWRRKAMDMLQPS